jgi:GT2 family glycosyltransferase
VSVDLVFDLSIALVSWNNREYVDQCLRSIDEAIVDLKYEIIVADHGSSDGTLEMLEEFFPDVVVIRNEENLGVARGNNQCIQKSKGRHILILNNDTVVNHDSITAMVDFLDEHPDAGAVGGNLLNPDGSLQSSFCYFPTLKEEFLIVSHLGKRFNPIHPSYQEIWPEVREVDWMSSASILVRREAIEDIGLIDEEYFIYSDETDWQYRLWQSGWKVYYLPEVTTIHYGGGSFEPGSRRFTLVYRGRMLFARKHYGALYCLVQRSMFAFAALFRELVWAILYLLPGWRNKARAQLRNNLETLILCIRLK